MRQEFPEEAFQSVLKSYGHHFDSGRLRSELQVLYSDQDLQGNRGKLCDYLVFLKDMELDSAMPQLYKLFSLVATIGATSAGVERSFSCLKRLKSNTRNTMGQGRLSSLALLAIEKTLPVCLAAAGSVFAGGTESWVTGWGTLQAGGEPSDTLQEIMLPIVNNSACYNAYGGGITSEMICAGFLNVAGKSSCQGDSGGPMVIRNSSRWVQSGIVSFGAQRCDDPRYPSVSTRVSQFQDWIKSYMGSNLPGFVASSGSRSSLNLLLFPFFLTFSVIPFTFSLYLSS
ncbi:serine protease [Pimephales promelas]|nr:serine protease [Pimephales promelas]